jgi:hypothetical protein
MQALNHTVFGSLIAVTVTEPALAVPLALASHFVLDSIPHYGNDPNAPAYSRPFFYRVAADFIASTLMILFFLSLHPPNPTLLVVCAIVAISPDFLWPVALKIKQKGPLWDFFKFHKNIQTESRSGIFVEIVWFILTASLVVYKIRA